MTNKEREQWIELAGMLGFSDLVHREYFRDEGDAQAMLIGLACHEANGEVRHTTSHPSRSWTWRCESEAGLVCSRPAAAIEMLKAFREANQ